MRITIGDIKTNLGVSESYDIVNAIRNSASSQFQQYVPLANADNIAQVGAGLATYVALQNEFLTALVDRIGLVVIKSVSLENPLKKFKKGAMPLGRTIEEIFVDITEEKLYDAEEAEQTVFKRELPDTKTLFHERNRQGYYKQTIQDESLKSAFVSWGDFDNFLSRVINAVYNSAEVDEYKYMKLLMDNYASKGLFKSYKVANPLTSEANAKAFIKKVRATAKRMTLPMGTRDFNAMGVHTRSSMADLHLIITAELEATVDVDVLAAAFNMSKTDFLGNVTVIDNFATPGLQAVLIDSDFFMVYDTLHRMETIRNPQGLYWNYLYHVWQVLSVSRFGNAVAFYDETASLPTVSQVILSPVVTRVKPGGTASFEATVRINEGAGVTPKITVAYTVVREDGTVIKAGTSVSNGVLTVAAAEPAGRLLVKATATAEGEESKTATGEAVAVVIG